ncbi:MAG: hypothetical protein ACLSB9_36070 [Hydrogeniiclostridium mannosilyticum]
MNNGNAAVLCAAGMDEIPSYENLRQQFPPEELYPEEILRSLIDKGRYQIFLYKRASDNALIGYADVLPTGRHHRVAGLHCNIGGVQGHGLWRQPVSGAVQALRRCLAGHAVLG